jgi:hypothetical protein
MALLLPYTANFASLIRMDEVYMSRYALIVGWILLSGMSFAAYTKDSNDPKVQIVRAEFGVFGSGDDGVQIFEPASVVPHKVGQRYGWVIDVQTRVRSLSVREEYVLPISGGDPDAMDLLNGSILIRIPRRNQVSQRQLVPVEGRIYGEWALGPDEPAGRRNLQVIIENQAIANFEFEVK